MGDSPIYRERPKPSLGWRIWSAFTGEEKEREERPHNPRDWTDEDVAGLFKVGYVGTIDDEDEDEGLDRSTRAAAVIQTPMLRYLLWRMYMRTTEYGQEIHTVRASPHDLSREDADRRARKWAERPDGGPIKPEVIGYGTLSEFEDAIGNSGPSFVRYTLTAYPHEEHVDFGQPVELWDHDPNAEEEFPLWRPSRAELEESRAESARFLEELERKYPSAGT